MPFFAVTYTYTDDTEQRDAVRPDHRAFLSELLLAGTLAASGPLADEEGQDDAALLIVRAADEAAVFATLDTDPFYVGGLLAGRSARGWSPVIGPWSEQATSTGSRA